ncbi:histidine kinase [Spirillospora sp. NPDC047279]|uniref:sensor histidine kinase n=1 Tax=Spirillospora sp. NPDC047279 TaxID=3155478 RepID=UPI0033C10B9B
MRNKITNAGAAWRAAAGPAAGGPAAAMGESGAGFGRGMALYPEGRARGVRQVRSLRNWLADAADAADAGRRRPDVDIDKVERKGPSPAGMCVCLVFLAWPAKHALTGGGGPAWAMFPALVVIAGLYVATVLTAFSAKVPLRAPIGLFGVLMLVTGLATWGFGERWYPLFPMLGLAAGSLAGHVRARHDGPDLPLVVIIGLPTGLSILVPALAGESGQSMLGYAYGTATAGLVTAIVLRLHIVIGMLRDARGELAHAAVEQERLRFSRDLHDLLGHTLSIMVVKAQVARRLAGRDPVLAAEQAADIETVGRQALTEVREAVSGYRGRGLNAELDAAHTALADAGVEMVVRRTGPPPPAGPDALLGWAIREGVTNVIRHSLATRCEITLRNDGERVTAEIRNNAPAAGGAQSLSSADGLGGVDGVSSLGGVDGLSGVDGVSSLGGVDGLSGVDGVDGVDRVGRLSGGTGGHGLKGLGERMAGAGGAVEAGPAADGGFVLVVRVPLGDGR